MPYKKRLNRPETHEGNSEIQDDPTVCDVVLDDAPFQTEKVGGAAIRRLEEAELPK